jgi:hypothetical protein
MVPSMLQVREYIWEGNVIFSETWKAVVDVERRQRCDLRAGEGSYGLDL